MKSSTSVNSRREAAFVLMSALSTREFPANILGSGPDRAFVQDLVYTALRRLRPLRLVLGKLVRQWPKGELEALLYVGAAQILYMPSVKDYAAVNETVDAAKACENPSIARVVNGVLRNLLRRRDEMLSLIASSPADIRESFPRALYRRWAERFGEDAASALMAWHNESAVTFLAYKDGSFKMLERAKRVEDAPGFAEGDFIVQNPATSLAVLLVDAKPGENILDACAAPGGKTIQLAWRSANVTACEINPRRRKRLEENLLRTRLHERVRVIAELPANGAFDKVLVDAPCSNTGVIRRRPDARWNWSEVKLSALVKLQADILDHASSRVRPGGAIIYSTCSNEPEENQLQVQAFLARHPEYFFVREEESIPSSANEMDGAYAALLVRNK